MSIDEIDDFSGLLLRHAESGHTVHATWVIAAPGADGGSIAVDCVSVLAGEEQLSSGGIATSAIAAYNYTSGGIDMVESFDINDEVYRELRESSLPHIDIVTEHDEFTVPLLFTRPTGAERAR